MYKNFIATITELDENHRHDFVVVCRGENYVDPTKQAHGPDCGWQSHVMAVDESQGEPFAGAVAAATQHLMGKHGLTETECTKAIKLPKSNKTPAPTINQELKEAVKNTVPLQVVPPVTQPKVVASTPPVTITKPPLATVALKPPAPKES